MELIDQYFPKYKDVGGYFKEYLKKYINPQTRLLDVGCGRKAFGEELYKIARYRVGTDPDQEALAENVLMDEKFHNEIEALPNFDEKFDVIIAQWVLEHVNNPHQVIQKIADNCAPGGYFLFMTTNLYSPVILMSKIFPTFVKKYLKNRLLKIPENETYATHYKINTAAKLDAYLTHHGFKKIELEKIGVLTYFSVNKPILFTKAWLDKLLLERFKIFKPFSTHLTGVYQKI